MDDLLNIYSYITTLSPRELANPSSVIPIAIIILIIQNFRHRAHNFLSIWIYFIMGTFFHELMHYIVSLITNGKPKSFNIFPSRTGEGWSLGSVEIQNPRWYNMGLISMAPLLLLPLSFFWEKYYFQYFDYTYTVVFFYYFGLVNFITSALPSSVDFSHAFKNLVSLCFFIFTIILFIYFARELLA